MGTKREIASLCDKDFYRYLGFWSKFHVGMGLPSGKHYLYEQPDIVMVIEAFEWMYREHSGIEIVSQKIETIGSYLKAGFNLKEK